jgi:hypothetical protein
MSYVPFRASAVRTVPAFGQGGCSQLPVRRWEALFPELWRTHTGLPSGPTACSLVGDAFADPETIGRISRVPGAREKTGHPTQPAVSHGFTASDALVRTVGESTDYAIVMTRW